jgi:hypothetical protein
LSMALMSHWLDCWSAHARTHTHTHTQYLLRLT